MPKSSDKALLRSFPKGIVLFNEGDKGREMYVIHKGQVRISKHMGDVEKTMSVLGVGDFFGEMALLHADTRFTTATVTEKSELLVIEPDTFEKMISDNAEIAFRIIQTLTARLKAADEQIANLVLGDPLLRVIDCLINQCKQQAENNESIAVLSLTPEDLAEHVGLKPSYAYRILDQLHQEKLVELSNDTLVIQDRDALQRYFTAIQQQPQKSAD